MIGKIYPSFFQFKDKATGVVSIKSRPMLIIAEPIGMDTEYNVLPVSTVSRKEFLRLDYDVPIEKSKFPLLKLNNDSYIRVHKQTIVYRTEIDFRNCIGDLKLNYSETFFEVLEKLRSFENKIIEDAKK